MVVTDQPFTTVDVGEFRDLLTYIHHPSPTLIIPHRDAMKRRIIKLGDDTIAATRAMFRVCVRQFGCYLTYLTHKLIAFNYIRMMLKAKSAFRSTHGRRATTSRSWQ